MRTMSHHAQVRQFSKMLGNLDAWIEAALAFAAKKSFDPEVFVSARLAPDQFAFVKQVLAACDGVQDVARIASRMSMGRATPRDLVALGRSMSLAGRIAAALGFDDRSEDDPDALGTSFLVLEPTIEPADLCSAVERNWWPALACNSEVPLLARIEDVAVDGTSTPHFPRPKQNKDLQPFIRGFELADRTHENSKVEEYRKDLGTSGAGANASLRRRMYSGSRPRTPW